ncbi:hypothetical protein EPO17_03755 [Patescibacteria group bacterium]|nr:MAG: hypothetical protein EPO17_03755 [Patescibacteria group bacterium]
MFNVIVSRTKRVPSVWSGLPGNGEAMTRQLDVSLLSVGFKLSGELFRHLSVQSPAVVKDVAFRLIPVVNEMLGSHVPHNVYFKNFPDKVPDTREFWLECICDALSKADSAAVVAPQIAVGFVNLLDLPKYGECLHSYDEMVKCHDQFIPSIKDKIKVLCLGNSLQDETVALYHELAGSSVPLNDGDRKLISKLAKLCLDDRQPQMFPVRENKALVNQIRIQNGKSILVDTVTDVLRMACALSDGDVTLTEKTKFKSLSRKIRRGLMEGLSEVLVESPAKMVDVNRHQEQWKRLGERLHPHEFPLPVAKEFFAVARGDKAVNGVASQLERAIGNGDIALAISILERAPGMLFRSLDRLVLLCEADVDLTTQLLMATRNVVGQVSGRVLISVWEHLSNRLEKGEKRIFTNSKGKTWAQNENRRELPSGVVSELVSVIKTELCSRLSKMGIDGLQVDPDFLGVALPLTEKNKSSGFGVMPKGSVVPVHGKTLRFFMYWKQKGERTDYDLGAFFMNESFQNAGHVSWTNLRDGSDGNCVHSGDIVNAPCGASEFIDMKLGNVAARYIVPQINRYSGESFQDVEENLFGFMERETFQNGKPFEAKTVKVKAEIRGKGMVAIPAVFMKASDDSWSCKWLDFQLAGYPNMNTIEGNKFSTSLLIQAVVNRVQITVRDLAELLPGSPNPARMAYVGFQKPENLQENQKVFTLDNLTGLIPK